MRLSLYEKLPQSSRSGSFLWLLFSKDEISYIAKGFDGGTPKLKVRGLIGDGLIFSISDQGYSLGSPLTLGRQGPDVAAAVQISCTIVGARQAPAVKPPMMIDLKRVVEDGQPVLRLEPMPELTVEGFKPPFNPVVAPGLRKVVEKPPLGREATLAIVAKHTDDSKPAPMLTAKVNPAPPWGAAPTVTPPSAPPVNGATPAPVSDSARSNFIAAIEMVNETVQGSSGGMSIAIKDGKLRGVVRREVRTIVEEEV